MAGREGAITVSDKVESGETDGPQVTVVVHPLVLLSTVDHYTRVAKDTRKRVVGVLLGEIRKGQVDVTNSFAGACKRHRNSSCSFEVPCAAAGCAALGRSMVA